MSHLFKTALIRGALTGVVCGAIVVCMICATLTGIDKEIHRQDTLQVHNCALYGHAINKLAGEEICPPTPQG